MKKPKPQPLDKVLAKAQLQDCLKTMPQGTRLGILKSQRKPSDDLPLFRKPEPLKLF